LSNILTIPADVVPDVREGLFCLMGEATQGLDQALIRPGRHLHREWFADDRTLLEHVFAMLDLIGWDVDREPHAVAVELEHHGQRLSEAVDRYLPLLEVQETEADVDDERRADEGKPPIKEEITGRLAALRNLAALIDAQLAW
jgi:hypothetical protein